MNKHVKITQIDPFFEEDWDEVDGLHVKYNFHLKNDGTIILSKKRLKDEMGQIECIENDIDMIFEKLIPLLSEKKSNIYYNYLYIKSRTFVLDKNFIFLSYYNNFGKNKNISIILNPFRRYKIVFNPKKLKLEIFKDKLFKFKKSEIIKRGYDKLEVSFNVYNSKKPFESILDLNRIYYENTVNSYFNKYKSFSKISKNKIKII